MGTASSHAEALGATCHGTPRELRSCRGSGGLQGLTSRPQCCHLSPASGGIATLRAGFFSLLHICGEKGRRLISLPGPCHPGQAPVHPRPREKWDGWMPTKPPISR